MEDIGGRIPNVLMEPVKRKQLGKLVAQGPFEGSGMFGTRVLSPKIYEATTTNNNGFSGGSYRAMTVVNNDTGDPYNIKVSSRMQLATPSPDVHPPSMFDNLAQPEDDTANTQRLAIGTSRSTSVEVSEQLFNPGRFLSPKSLASQTMPYSPERENVSLFIEKMHLRSDEKFTCPEDTLPDTGFQFQDPGDITHDKDLSGMINDIDKELDKAVPGQDKHDYEDFHAVNRKCPIVEETVPSLGVQVRTVGSKPVEDLSNLNIVLTSGNHQADYQKALYALLLKIKASKNAAVTPSSCFKEGHVVFGTDKACKEMLEKSEFLPSHGTHGVLMYDRLRPKAGQYTEDVHFSATEVLGKGNFGEVKLCQDKTTKAKFVRKQMTNDYRKSEVEIMMSLKHQNITRFYGVIKREGTDEILMEYSGTSLLLFTLMPDTQHLVTEEFISNVNRQGLSAIAYLAIYGIIHLDIKPENTCILETATGWTVKLTDFGSAKMPHDQLSYNGWTAEYMSPEACINFLKCRFPQMSVKEGEVWTVTSKSDVYGWGLTVMFMYRKLHLLIHAFTGGQNNYKNVADPAQVKLLIIISMARDPDMVRNCLIPDDCSQDMKQLLCGLLAGDPTQRLSASEAVTAIDKISTDKLLSTRNPFIDLSENDLDCFIYEPSEVSSPAPGPTRFRRPSSVSSCMSSQGSVCSTVSYTSNASVSKKSGPYKGSLQNGTGRNRRRIVKKKLRDRIESPRNDGFENLVPATDLDGNIPDFSALV
ncbi:uncharacterized protein LOC117344318 [Pecten maximus]|uniref:uncharacterized protein LOC117344318 n=1 Tax=Pecten maximus TaxID=6579 RepID=UPI0014584133|nr:uncharacterized protein LOC117344318 [Pecten maximus]